MSDNLDTAIDAYAAIKSQLADLEMQKRAIEKSLADLPAGAYESENHRLTISNTMRSSPDEALKEDIAEAVELFKATLSRQYLAAHTVETSVRTHRIGARNGKNLAA